MALQRSLPGYQLYKVRIGSDRYFIVTVHNRTADILLGQIKQWIKPGTFIISDCWMAYGGLSVDNYEH